MRIYGKPQRVVVFLSLALLLVAVCWMAVAAAPLAQTDFDCANVTQIPQSECEALVALYNSTNGPGWADNAGWLTTNEPCGWKGVICQDGHVKLLSLREQGLSGSIPPELGNLVYLQQLSLFANRLSGTIPPQLANLDNLRWLDLHDNDLSGTIPPELATLDNLEILHLGINNLSGTIPPQLTNLDNLAYLHLADNALSGIIPPELANLVNLEALHLEVNNLNGTIPPQLANLNNLRWLDLHDNDLSGSIPPELANLDNLWGLLLADNGLSGTIPPQLGNLGNLFQLDLSNNNLRGAIPPELANLTLLYLHLDSNNLSGAIPPELGNLAHLQELFLDSNSLSGTIPSQLGNLGNLFQLDLSNNNLSGVIPPQLATLEYLWWLDLSNNALSGAIPPELSNRIYLERLDLSYNALTATDDPDLLAWLAQRQPDWAETQTVAPSAVQASALAADYIVVSWTPIRYAGDGGYHEISYAMDSAGPFIVHGVTPDKTSTEYILTGLAPGTLYFVRVRTYTPSHRNNQNDVWSDYSEVVMATTFGGDTGLINPGFESGVEGWRFHTDGSGALSKDRPGYRSVAAGRIDIATAGGNTQLYQTGFTLRPNTRYRLQFFAKSSTGHDLTVYVHQHNDPYTNYGVSNFRVNLTPTWKRFTIDFTSKRFTVPTTDTRLRFWLSGLAKANDSYWFDDISLVELSPTLIAAQAQGVGEVQGLVQGATSPTTIQLVDSESEGAVYQVTTVTDAAGHFQLTAVPYGNYELRVTPPLGYLVPEAVQFAVSDEPNEELSFALTPITSTYFLPQISR